MGVARQYCGRLGKTDNCQIAVRLSIANHAASLPIAYRLYLPEDWAVDEARRKEAGVPDDVTFQTKPEIALAQIRAALAAGVAPGVLLTDAGYGADGAFRSAVTASGLTYVVGVQSTLSVWPPGVEPPPPKPWSGRGRPPSRMRRDSGRIPVSAKTLARGLPEEAWRIVPWREGSNEILSSRFAAVRIRPASRDWKFSTPHPLEWLLIEWPEGEKEPAKYWLSTLPEDIPFEWNRLRCARRALSGERAPRRAYSAIPGRGCLTIVVYPLFVRVRDRHPSARIKVISQFQSYSDICSDVD